MKAAEANLSRRTQPNATFLWALEDPSRAAQIRNGGIAVAPVLDRKPKKAPGGLIHHWTGAAFLPNVKLDELLELTRNYDRYKELYAPSVVESKALTREANTDRFSLRLLNKALFLKKALDADFVTENVRVNDSRWYSIARTTRVQEIEGYAEPGQRSIPEGQGSGYIWKMCSFTRLEQRDGGVYVEMETMALSRDIPGAIAIVANPIVRRVSRNSLFTSLKQTQAAVRKTLASAQTGPAGAANQNVVGSVAH